MGSAHAILEDLAEEVDLRMRELAPMRGVVRLPSTLSHADLTFSIEPSPLPPAGGRAMTLYAIAERLNAWLIDRVEVANDGRFTARMLPVTGCTFRGAIRNRRRYGEALHLVEWKPWGGVLEFDLRR